MAAILLLSTLLLSLSTIILSLSQNIIIHCGGASGFYNDTENNVIRVGDERLIKRGKSSRTQSNGPEITLRYFPSASGELNCYENIPATRGRKKLVRTFFSYGNYDKKSSPPSFLVLYDKKHFEKVVLPPLDDEGQSEFRSEVIFSPASTEISVCLVRTSRSQNPFISSIEVYGMEDDMYNDLGDDEGFMLIRRVAFGAKKIISYPSDPYGRFWYPLGSPNSEIRELKTSTSIDITDASNKPPEIVMRTAWSVDEIGLLQKTLSLLAGKTIYLALYFSEPDETHKRSFNVYLDKEQLGPIKPIFGKATQVVKKVQLSTSSQLIFESAKDSDLPQIINALELYLVSDGKVGGKFDWNRIYNQTINGKSDQESEKEEKQKLAVEATADLLEAAKEINDYLEKSKTTKSLGLPHDWPSRPGPSLTRMQKIGIGVGVTLPTVAAFSAYAAKSIAKSKKANPESNTAPAATSEESGAETGESPLVGGK